MADGLRLLFTIAAKDDASDEFKKLRRSFDAEVGAIRNSSRSAFVSVANDIGLTTKQAAALSTTLPVIGAAIAAVTAVTIGAGVAAFATAKNWSDAGSRINDLSIKTGLGAEAISGLKLAAETTNATIEDLSQGVIFLTRTIAEAEHGSEPARAKLERLGLDPKKAVNDLQGALDQVFRSIRNGQTPVEQTARAIDAFGRSGANLKDIAFEAKDGINGLIERARELGLLFTSQDAKAADEFGDTLRILELQAMGAANTIGRELGPALTESMRDLSTWLKENRSSVEFFGRTVKGTFEQSVNIINGFTAALRLSQPVLDAYLRTKNLIDGSGGSQPQLTTATAANKPALPDTTQRKGNELKIAAQVAQVDAENAITQAQILYERGAMNRQQQIDATIAAKRRQLNADVAAIGEEIANKHAEFEALDEADTKHREKVQADIDKFQGDILAKQAAFRREAQTLLLQAQQQEQKEREDHIKAVLDIQTNALEDANKRLKEAHEINAVSDEEFLTQTKKNEDAILQIKENSLRRQLEQNILTVEERKKLGDDLRALQATEATQAQDQAARSATLERTRTKETNDVSLANERQLIQIREELRATSEDAIKRLVRDGVITESEAAARIGEIRQQAFEDEKTALENELHVRETTAARAAEITNQLILLDVQRARTAIETTDQIIQARIREQNAAIAALGGVNTSTGTDSSVGGLAGEIDKIMGGEPPPPPDFSAWHGAFEALKSVGVGAFNSLSQGMGSMIQSFLMGGKAGQVSLAGLLKAVAASLAAQALVEAAMEGARAIKEYALAASDAAIGNVAGAALHTAAGAAHVQAAIAFGLVGGVAAIAALALPSGAAGNSAVAGQAFNQSGTSSTGTREANAAPKPVEIEENRRVIEHRHVFEIHAEEGITVRHVLSDLTNPGGAIRRQVQMMTGEPVAP